MQEMEVQSLGLDDPLEGEIAAHSRVLAWGTPLIEEHGKLRPWGHRRVRQDLVTSATRI